VTTKPNILIVNLWPKYHRINRRSQDSVAKAIKVGFSDPVSCLKNGIDRTAIGSCF
jgi:hypothetical protein